MTIADDQFERLLRDSAVRWSVSLSAKGDGLISVGEWLAFAQPKLTDDVSDAALEAATDAYLSRIGGEKLPEAHMFNWLRRLAGRDELPTGWTYSFPSRLLRRREFRAHGSASDGDRRAADIRQFVAGALLPRAERHAPEGATSLRRPASRAVGRYTFLERLSFERTRPRCGGQFDSRPGNCTFVC